MSVFVWGMWMSSNEPGVFLFEPDLSLLSSKSYISLLVGAYPLGALFHVRASQLEILSSCAMQIRVSYWLCLQKQKHARLV